MIKIQHRVNSLKKLKNTDHNFGVEVDVRSINKKLILNHEPFQKATSLDTFLKKFNHKFLILNVKEEGIENLILNYVKKNRIKNYFLLDVTVPKIFQFIKNKKNNNFVINEFPLKVKNRVNDKAKGGGSFFGKIKLTINTLRYIFILYFSLNKRIWKL